MTKKKKSGAWYGSDIDSGPWQLPFTVRLLSGSEQCKATNIHSCLTPFWRAKHIVFVMLLCVNSRCINSVDKHLFRATHIPGYNQGTNYSTANKSLGTNGLYVCLKSSYWMYSYKQESNVQQHWSTHSFGLGTQCSFLSILSSCHWYVDSERCQICWSVFNLELLAI